ncbi:MAG: aminoglycoside phosphotransferase family protein [Candidatus Paceibacterota bacterium]
MNIQEVLNKYFTESAEISIKQCKKGAINLTYHLIVKINGEKKEFILQKMNPIFNVSIMRDIDFITNHLKSKKIKTQKVVKTLEEKNFIRDGVSWWRVLTFIPGRSFNVMTSSSQAREAGKLIGLFHNYLSSSDYKFKFKLPHFHDTAFFMKKLRSTLTKYKNTDKYIELKVLAKNILISYEGLSKETLLNRRIIHGDLKINNILFDKNGGKAIALIDLDTLMRGNIAIELGDALRSWCMPGGEDVKKVDFDINIYNKALEGYKTTAKFLTTFEEESIPYGVKLVTLELAARFVIDAFEESYFVLDSLRYKTLFEQNKKRAENQYSFFEKFSNSFS